MTLADAGGGAGAWAATIESLVSSGRNDGDRRTGGRRPRRADARPQTGTEEGEISGVVVLRRETRRPAHPVLGPGRRPAARGRRRSRSSRPGAYAGQHARAARRASPSTAIRRCPTVGPVTSRLDGPRAGLPRPRHGPGRELRRRHHAARRGIAGRAARRRRPATRTGSRDTPRFRSTSTPTSTSSAAPTLVAGAIQPEARHVPRRLRQPELAPAPARFRFRFWMNDVDAADRGDREPACPRRLGRSGSASATSARGSTRPRSRRPSTAGRCARRFAAAIVTVSTAGHWRPACTASGSSSPTTRRRGTWRTSRGSCRTRASLSARVTVARR